MASNFQFLQKEFPVLAVLGSQAEQYIKSDPNSCLMKLGMMGETIVNLMFNYDNIALPAADEDNASRRIRKLYNEELLSDDLTDILHRLRKARNKAIHENFGNSLFCEPLLRAAYRLCEWFMQTYGDWNYEHHEFVMPVENADTSISSGITKDAEEKETKKMQKEAETKAKKTKKLPRAKRKFQAAKAWSRNATEEETRDIIDEQLRRVGWEADTRHIRYSKGTRPQRGRNLAIAEWPVDSEEKESGRADYALFVGLKLVAVIEAKAGHKSISSVIDAQCKDYAKHIRKEDEQYCIGRWGNSKVPFVFAANGRPYLEQLKTESGIWMRDMRKPSNVARALKGWMSPEGIMEELDRNKEEAEKKLKKLPYDSLTDPDELNLRDYQVRAIKAAEKAVLHGQQSVLLAMATGTGKTRTVLGLMYRFLKTGLSKRILYLVDRRSLGNQAKDVFCDAKIEEGLTLDEIYNINGIECKDREKETRVYVATVQSMIKRILYHESDSDLENDIGYMPAVSDYDLIIIDEAHRGYAEDKEMGELELLYRDQKDFQSKYRSVIDYFDAIKIALTATPALQTTQIFGKPVFTYSYREAVLDGYLADHDAPHHLETKLSREGIHYKKGDFIKTYDKKTNKPITTELVDDEIDFDVEDFNRKVINNNFDTAVLEEISKYLDPENPETNGKTLIYAVNDMHADRIVDILKKIYEKDGLDWNAIQKITGKTADGDRKRIDEAIRNFRTEKYPSIVVTVDLLTTGIDVPEITALVFMRCVKSRILFEQMLGRATRLCPKIHKDSFEIFDPVGAYDAMESFNTMKPLVVNPAVRFADLLDGYSVMKSEEKIEYQNIQIIAKLQRKRKKLSEENIEIFKTMSGGKDPKEFIDEIKKRNPTEARDFILEHRELFEAMDNYKGSGGINVIINESEDVLVEHSRKYGNTDSPEDYLDAFSAYLASHKNEIDALHIICTSPKDLTRTELKTLGIKLDNAGFSQITLNTAIKEAKKSHKEIAADLITLIRRFAIGSPLINHETRIEMAVDKLVAAHDFTKAQMTWIDRIKNYLMKESVINPDAFNEDVLFKDKGGYTRADKVLDYRLVDIISELNHYLYDDDEGSAV